MSDFMDRWLGTNQPEPQTSNVIPLRPHTEGIHPYADAIRRAWVDKLLRLKSKSWVQGDAWDTTSYASARKFSELANSPWSGYTHADAHADYMSSAPHNAAWDKRIKCWERGAADAGSLPEPPPGATYEIPTVTVLPDPHVLDAFWHARPILTHLHTFARARRVAPWAVLGYAMARIVAATAPSFVLPPIIGGPASLNLFVGIVGPSGAGKGAANAVAREAIKVGDLVVLNPGSGEGIIHAYARFTLKEGLEQHTTSVLFNVPEIDTLAAVGSRQGSTVMPILRSGWSGEQIGTQTADPTRRVLVRDHAYRMCMVAGIQPGRASALLDDADGGTPQRFLWFPATDPHMPDKAPLAPARVTIMPRDPYTSNSFTSLGSLTEIPVCKTARDVIIDAHLARVRGLGDALDGHALLTRLKTAAALALLEQRREVTDDDWELSATIMAVSDATRTAVIAQRAAAAEQANEAKAKGEGLRQVIVNETVAEKAERRISPRLLRVLKDAGPMSRSKARKELASRDRAHFDGALDHLIRGGLVAEKETEHGVILTIQEESC